MTQVDFYDKGQIDAMNVGKETDTASASGSLWARLKDALNKIAGKADDNAVVKLTGDQTVGGVKTFSSSPIVPDTPATEHSAVNQIWAENVAYSDDTVNNLIHKEGSESITGTKTFTNPVYVSRYSNQICYYLRCVNMELGNGTTSTGCRINFIDKNDVVVCSLRAGKAANDKITLYAELRNTDGTTKLVTLAESDVI